jgi:ABC-2 type transport system ATP-binding protein
VIERAEQVLILDEVCKTFVLGNRPVAALTNVSLRVRPGVVTGLIGPDGAGKTTLMRLAAGLLQPDSGRIEVMNIDVTREPLAVQATLGYMPQRFGLYEDLTVAENLNLYADLQGLPRAARQSRYQELMRMTGLAPFTARLAGRLSGGMKQKLGLACTLVRAPRLLLLDEPTVGVDPVSRRELWAIVYRLVEAEGMSVLLSTAYLDEAERCSEVVLLHEGRVLGHDEPAHFSAQVEGRTYGVSAAGASKRQLQEQLLQNADVMDATIQSEHLRVITRGVAAPVISAWLPLAGATLTAVAPRFEDSFIAMLKRDMPPRNPSSEGTMAAAARRRHDGVVIEVAKLERRFGDFYAVKDVNFEVRAGEIFGLLGANGAGKSTTFRMLCGLLPASGGKLRVAGRDLRYAAAAARARIGYMAQKFSLYGNLTVMQNLAFFSSAYGLRGAQRRQRIAWAVGEFALAANSDSAAGDLPLGFKQRLALACALMHEPDILFLDEPTSGVDPLARREFWRRINALAESGVTVMVTTHFMEEAEYCDRIAIMQQGSILTIGTPSAIKRQARSAARPDPSMEDAFIALIESEPAVAGA